MKNLTKLIIVLLFAATIANAQNNFSIGFVGTQFGNIGSGEKLTKIENPFGYGLLLGYKFDKNLSVALTNEFLKDNMKNNLGKESDFRVHASAYLTPVKFGNFHPYLSAGFVYTNRKYDYKFLDDETKSLINGRFGLGVDYNFFSNLSLNLDFGLYNDGLMLAGYTTSFGLRINPNF
ncbi:MAG: hypothetical protein Fur0015_12420 [Ignavibacteriales bacterium]